LGKRFGLWPEIRSHQRPHLAEYFTQLTTCHGCTVPRCCPNVLPRGTAWLVWLRPGRREKKKFDTIYFGDKSITATNADHRVGVAVASRSCQGFDAQARAA